MGRRSMKGSGQQAREKSAEPRGRPRLSRDTAESLDLDADGHLDQGGQMSPGSIVRLMAQPLASNSTTSAFSPVWPENVGHDARDLDRRNMGLTPPYVGERLCRPSASRTVLPPIVFWSACRRSSTFCGGRQLSPAPREALKIVRCHRRLQVGRLLEPRDVPVMGAEHDPLDRLGGALGGMPADDGRGRDSDAGSGNRCDGDRSQANPKALAHGTISCTARAPVSSPGHPARSAPNAEARDLFV